MAKAGGPINAERLQSFVERIERLEEEKKAIGGDVRDIYSEAKGVGYDVKTIRKVVAERKIDAADRDEQEALLDTYRHALGMMSYRQAAEHFGISKSKLQRLVPKNSNGTVPREMVDGDLGDFSLITNTEADSLTADAGRPSEPSAAAPQGVNACPPSGRVPPTSDVGQAAQSGNHSESAPSSAPAMGVSATAAPCASGEGAIAARSDTPAEIMGEMPAHLRRERAA